MQIIMKTLDAGPKGVRHPGKAYDVPADEAKALIDGGYAEAKPVKVKPVETADGPAGDDDGKSAGGAKKAAGKTA